MDLAPDLRPDWNHGHKAGKQPATIRRAQSNAGKARASGSVRGADALAGKRRLTKSPIRLPAVSFLKDEG